MKIRLAWDKVIGAREKATYISNYKFVQKYSAFSTVLWIAAGVGVIWVS